MTWPQIPKRLIHGTSLSVSALGLGTVKFGRNTAVKYPTAFTLPTDKALLNLLAKAWELGINLLDTAPAYGISESRLGQLLPTLKRDWLISTKVGEFFCPQTGQSQYRFDPISLRQSVENSLRTLKREVLDIVLIHSNGDDTNIIERDEALLTLQQFKQAGLIRAIGMSTKTVSGGLLALQQADIAMVMHHLHYREEEAVIDYATMNNKAIFIKKALDSGHLMGQSPSYLQKNFDLIYQHPAVCSVIIGTLNPRHLLDNARLISTALGGQSDQPKTVE